MMGVLISSGGETQRHRERMASDPGGRDCSDAVTSQGMPGATRGGRQEGSSPRASRGSRALPTPYFQTPGLQN